jgi:putative membrane protein insertion efficiency factor
VNAAARLLHAGVRGYQRFLSPFLGGQCRFEPSCSHYALACLERHGAWRGFCLGLGRILRCQPLCKGGYDPPPP